MKLWITLSLFVILSLPALAAKTAPNFILILTDDQGWSSMSAPMDLTRPAAKSDYHQTPNMDALLNKGMRFTNGYAASPVCSPTRYSILFGKSPARLHRTRVLEENKVDHEQKGIPQLLKMVNPDYRCAHLGKWHIDADPDRYGYDVHDGRTGNVEGGFDHRNRKREWGGYVEEDPKRVDSLTERAIQFMRDSVAQKKPFFLQLSHYAVHSDIVYSQASFDAVGTWQEGELHSSQIYAAMLRDLDNSIGTLLEAYEALGLAEDTYIIFTSDNGGVPVLPIQLNRGRPYKAGLNTPLLRGKWDLTEGGIRVPFAIAGPGIVANTQSDTPVVSYDLLPTILDFAGATDHLPPDLDGGSIRPVLENSEAAVSRKHDALIFHFPHYNVVGMNEPHSAIRVGDYKLIHFPASDRSLMFKISRDISESHNLAKQEPERANTLRSMLMDYLTEVKAERPEDSRSWKRGEKGKIRTKFFSRYSD